MNRLEGRFAAGQIAGDRDYQQDDYGLIEGGDTDADGGAVLLLSDGMGGHVSGETASRMIVKTFVETYNRTEGPVVDRLRTCLDAANDALADATSKNPELNGMGATVAAAVVSQRGLEWISVGDSPLWLLRDGRLRRLNADHSMAPVLANLVKLGRMTANQAATDSNRHALRSAVTGDAIHMIDVSSEPVALRKSDRVLLASDGLMTLKEEEIARILRAMKDMPPDDAVGSLLDAVEAAYDPYQDNTTVLLYVPEADGGEETTPEDASVAEDDLNEPNRGARRGSGLSGLWSALTGKLTDSPRQ
ncbi:MAG: protein phosphatase 2C domain-containing protein [Candidatus Latescibacteria bacterium]|nr:protein phosphatase 2C domain-containing protein [Candidatus Latescibacterota bacterium]